MLKMHSVIKYAFAALLLLGANSSYASTLWKNNEESTLYPTAEAAGQGYIAYKVANSASYYNWQYCGLSPYGGTYKVKYTNYVNSNCSGLSSPLDIVAGDCPSGYEDDGSGTCVAEPQYSCTAGKVIVASVTRPEGGNFPTEVCAEQSLNTGQFCMYGSISPLVITQDNTTTIMYRSAEESPLSCSAQDAEVEEVVYLPFDPNSYTGQVTAQDTVFDSNTEEVLPQDSVCVSNGDGTSTCVTVNTTVSTSTTGQGTTTSTTDGQTVTQVTSTGTVSQQTKTSTVTDDGNGTVTEQVDYSNTTHIGSKSTLIASPYNFTVGTTPSSETLTSTTTTTTITSPDGTQTTTTETKSDTGAPKPSGDSSVEGNCGAPGQPSCEITLSGEDELADPSTVPEQSGILDAFDTFTTSIASPEDDVSDTSYSTFDTINMYAGGTCNTSAFETQYHSAIFQPFAGFCSFYDDEVRPMVSFMFYILTIIGLYRIYTTTVRQS